MLTNTRAAFIHANTGYYTCHVDVAILHTGVILYITESVLRNHKPENVGFVHHKITESTPVDVWIYRCARYCNDP